MFSLFSASVNLTFVYLSNGLQAAAPQSNCDVMCVGGLLPDFCLFIKSIDPQTPMAPHPSPRDRMRKKMAKSDMEIRMEPGRLNSFKVQC